MDKGTALSALIASFIRSVNKYVDFNQRVFDVGSGRHLFPSEMHALNAIPPHGGLNVSELGKKLGITKSAASQVAIKLHKKGMVVKSFPAESNKNVMITLTKTGREIVRQFRGSQDKIFSLFMDFGRKLNTEKIAFL